MRTDAPSRRAQLALIVLTVLLAGATRPALSEPSAKQQTFLTRTAQAEQAELQLATMAARQAASADVKQLGQRMMADHHKAHQEVHQVASREGIAVPLDLSAEHQDKIHRLSQLSGKEFDHAYMKYLLQHHVKDVMEFEDSAKALDDPQVQQWALSLLPTLKEHLTMAKNVLLRLFDLEGDLGNVAGPPPID